MKIGVIKFNKHFKKALLLLPAVASLVSCTPKDPTSVFARENQSSQTTEYVVHPKQIVEALGADDKIMTQSYRRIKDNGTEPIYITFSDDYENNKFDGYKDAAMFALDYVFNIVKSINSKYTYKIISEEDLKNNKYLQKSVIQFHIDNLSDNGSKGRSGTCTYMNPWFIIKADSGKLELPEAYNKWTDGNLEDTYVHELLHTFGFGDVYDFQKNNELYLPTTMTPKSHWEYMTPNDYAMLLSYHAPKIGSTVELDSYIEFARTKLKAYDKHYYELQDDYFTNHSYTRDMIERYGEISRPNGLTQIKNRSIIYTVPTHTRYYEYDINDDKYKISILDEERNVMSSTEGRVVYTSNFIHLTDAKFERGLYPDCGSMTDKPLIITMMITKFGEKEVIINPQDMGYSIYHQSVEYENSPELEA